MSEINKSIAAQKILNHDEFDFKNSSIINPDFKDKERESIRKETVVVIDSRHRNKDAYPSPSKYVIDLDDDIQDVVTAEMTASSVPFKQYMINKRNNAFHFYLVGTNTKHKIVLPHGDYSVEELIIVLTTEMNKIFDVQIDYNKNADKFEFYGSQSFVLRFSEYSTQSEPYNLGKILGFNTIDYGSAPDPLVKYVAYPEKIIGEFRKNFDEKHYILLKISGFTVHHSVSQIIDKTFAIIPQTMMKQNNISVSQCFIKHFNPPVARLSKLQISFVNPNGDLVDFQNHDHYFILRFESFKHIRKYANFLDV